MQRFFLALREVVWSAVIAVVLAGLSILVALINPDAVALSSALGLSAAVSAFLSQRA